MTIRQALIYANNLFIKNNIDANKNNVIKKILADVLKRDLVYIVLNDDKELTNFSELDFKKKIKRYLNNEPLAYIIRKAEFCNNNFYVDDRVLIPRQETEELVNFCLNYFIPILVSKKIDNINILDLCTGSGVIGLSVASKYKKANVYLSDISKEAISVAKINARLLKIKNANFILGNFLESILNNKLKLNIILCNPPYIDFNDKNVSKQVKKFEPNLALFAPNNGLFFYKKLIENLENVLITSQPFFIMCEFGFAQKELIEDIFKKMNFSYNIYFKKDYNNIYRYIIITNENIK